MDRPNNMIELEIDGRKVEVPGGSTVMDAATQLGIFIPYFCYHKKLSIAANCRMCLVEVEKAPKPLPACATPVTPGMKVQTHSPAARKAQNGVMEFLLINHPLDCPICDQGGECQLQDLAVGYGLSASRYQEPKRVVANKNLGPLIATDMTRCIHCTRCVRFGQEIAGIMELGMAGRGEHSEILAFVGKTVDSELSGNVIDLCPVGALTSKPFRYSARTWELAQRRSVSPHCGLGSSLVVQVKANRVMRTLPRDNEEINQCWLSDKDRFSYEGLNSEERLTRPMIRRGEAWEECDWQTAIEFAAQRLRDIVAAGGPDQVGALLSPHSTLEELYLAQKLVRGLGSSNVDSRLRQSDFSLDGRLAGAPWLGQAVASLSRVKSALVIGSTLRKDHPLLALRLRQAVNAGADLNLVNPVDDELLTRVANRMIVPPHAMADALAQILKALAQAVPGRLGGELERKIEAVAVSDAARAIASSLQGAPAAVLLGNLAQHHPDYGVLHALAQEIARLAGAGFGVLGEAANSVGAYLAGAVPFHGPLGSNALRGMNAGQMLASPRQALLLLNLEPELDAYDARQAARALASAQFVLALTSYRSPALERAHVLLPVAPFTETSGTFVNTEGRAQSFAAVVRPLGETRPAWKVLRVLGNLMDLAGFDYESSDAVRGELIQDDGSNLSSLLGNQASGSDWTLPAAESGLQRIGEVPIYHADPIVRRAGSLQRTRDGAPPAARMHGDLMQKLGIKEGETVVLRQAEAEARLPAMRDDAVPDGCVRAAAAHALTAGLGGMLDAIQVERGS